MPTESLEPQRIGALDNPRWEKFCEYIVAGKGKSESYSLAFGNNSDAVRVNATDLFQKEQIQDRILQLRRSGLGDSGILSLQEKRRFLASVVRIAPGSVDENNPLCQSFKKRIRTEKDGTTEETIEYDLPNKLKALELDAKLAGELDGAAAQVMALAFFEIQERRDEGPVIDV